MAYSRYIPEIKDKDGNIYGVMDKEARAGLDRKYEKPSAGIPASDIASGVIPDVPIQDVQVNGTSVVQNGIVSIGAGLTTNANGNIVMDSAGPATIKTGANVSQPIVPGRQHTAAFYGLAKAAGDTTQSQSDNAVGTYTDEAKQAIQTMLGIDLSSIATQVETVDGAAVIITGQPNTRYMCGEVTSISITPPAVGSIDVFFTSGSTVAILTLPSTVKMPEWFDASALDNNTVYEILITDGVYGSVMTWAV